MPAELLVTHRGVVYPSQCDHMGHMNVMWYVGKFDEATWNLFAHLGVTPDYLRLRDRGMVAVRQVLDYRSELLAGDTLLVRSRVLEAREKVLRFEHEMLTGDGSRSVAHTEITGVHIDRSLRKSCPLPADVLLRAQALVATSVSD